ncbi:LOW QUALITY PROTEIN: hypothetical protein U9M48_032266, partial [Paspalum notatum var. saurae]
PIPPKKNRKPQDPTKKENFEERYTITHVGDDGQPLEPIKAATKFVSYCGIIREHPHKHPGLKKSRKKQNQSEDALVQSEADNAEPVVPQSVPKAQKELLWRELSNKFTLPEGTEAMGPEEVGNSPPNLQDKTVGQLYETRQGTRLSKIPKVKRGLGIYKESEEAIARSEQNSEISGKRKYNHNMGPGGYKRSIPKWEKMEAKLVQRGVNLPTANWPRRSKCWYYGYGGSLSSDGTLIFNDKIKWAAKRLVEAIDKCSKGEFVPEREKDELTLALENREHLGRTRGLGNVSWKDRGSYRKGRTLSEADAKIRSLEGKLDGLTEDIAFLRQILAENCITLAPQIGPHGDTNASYKKNSVASTQLIPGQNDDQEEAQQTAEEAQRPAEDHQRPVKEEKRYPMDDLKHGCSCELHIPSWNQSTAVVHGMALPVVPGQKFHCSDIPPGYSTVIVDQVVSSYEDLELQQKRSNRERTLKEVVHGRILWLKAYIKLVPENRDGGTTTTQSTATAGGGSPTDSAQHRSPNNDPPPRPNPPLPKSHTNDPPPSPSPTKNSKSSKKTCSKTTIKRPYDQTAEETHEVVRRQVEAHFAPKLPPKQQEIDPKAKKHFIQSCMEPSKKPMMSDYERQLSKAAAKKRQVP